MTKRTTWFLSTAAAAAATLGLAASASAASPYTVNSVADTPDPVLDDTCDVGGGICTLRAAIQEANANGGAQAINFSIGSGAATIPVGSELPPSGQPVEIDGTTQPGFTNAAGPLVTIDGSALGGADVNGLTLNDSANVVGLGISGFPGAGIQLNGGLNSFLLFNRITGNALDGVQVLGGSEHVVSDNRIFANGGLGIDLGPDGPTPNDAGDSDSGPNGLQNAPVITSAVVEGGRITVLGVLDSEPNQTYSIDLYTNSACDPSGTGEGEAVESDGGTGGALVTTNGAGHATFDTSVELAAGKPFVTATASRAPSDVLGSTSEFSPCSLALTKPELGETVVAGSGTTGGTFDPPGSRGPEALQPGVVIPIRSIIKVLGAGQQVQILSEAPNGDTRSGTFSVGAFQILQSTKGKALTNAKLVGQSSGKSRLAAKKAKKKKGKLFANTGRGHQTSGRSGSAIVRGTRWRTLNLPNGNTKFILFEGVLKITVKGKKKKVTLKPRSATRPGVFIAKG
jgi:CSLREA domain-containing protein